LHETQTQIAPLPNNFKTKCLYPLENQSIYAAKTQVLARQNLNSVKYIKAQVTSATILIKHFRVIQTVIAIKDYSIPVEVIQKTGMI
jgi:hypothetical protein